MIIPVRCFTCGAVIADKYEEFIRLTEEGLDPGEALDKLGVKRYCCRRMIVSQADVIDMLLEHAKYGERER